MTRDPLKRFITCALLAASLLAGCGGEAGPGDPDPKPGVDAGTGEPDSGPPPPEDAGIEPDPDPDPGPVPTDVADTGNTTKDSDCDGLTDAEEFANTYPNNLKTDPGRRDTDGDGIRDGVEVGRTTTVNTACTFRADQDPDSRTSPVKPDTDGDGLADGLEDPNRNGMRDPGETDPNALDSDGDGLKENEEDANLNGTVSPGETDPRKRDSDDDGLPDGLEKSQGTNPLNPDTDGDSCRDGDEDKDRDGVRDTGETDPRTSDCAASVPDADFDGIPDSVETATGTNRTNADSDGDGTPDGVEDENRNGRVDTNETDPRLTDTDCDGLQDGPGRGGFLGEDPNNNGRVDANETDPTNPDTDGDGLRDGLERGVATASAPRTNCGYAGDAQPTTTTLPTDSDTDDDGIPDGAEDANQNGQVDAPDELDPRNATDGAAGTPASQACRTTNLRTVTFKEDNGADLRLALPNTFQNANLIPIVSGGRNVGLIGWDNTKQVTLIAYRRGQVGSATDPSADEAGIRTTSFNSATRDFTQTFTTWDGFPALSARYTQAGTADLKTFTNTLARSLVSNSTGELAGTAGITGPFKMQAQYVHRSNQSVVVVLAITPTARYTETGSLFTTADTAGGSALAQFGDVDAVQCEQFTTRRAVVDFLFVVDDSGSMASSQTSLADAATAVANKLANATLDWRLGMVTTSYTTSSEPNTNLLRGFTRNVNQFRAWLTQNSTCQSGRCSLPTVPAGGELTSCTSQAQCWVNIDGTGSERSLDSARKAINDLAPVGTAEETGRIRPGAKLVVVILTDTRDQSSNPVATFQQYFQDTGGVVGESNNPLNQVIQVHGIICPPDGPRCYVDPDNANNYEENADPRHLEIIQATGGVYGSIRDAASITTTINGIVDSVISSVGYRTLKPPIGASLKVSVAQVTDTAQCPSAADIPRSRTHGFDVDGISRTVSFFGGCRPSVAGTTKAAVSYRYWSDRTPNPNGTPPPCQGDPYYNAGEADFCTGKLACNVGTNKCECPSDCGGGGSPGQVCNTDPAVCTFTCASDCGGTCGTYETCNTATCACTCVQTASCAAGYRFDSSACGCVCDTAALNCGGTYQADPNACACVCKPDCGGCGPNKQCNPSSCSCEGVIG